MDQSIMDVFFQFDCSLTLTTCLCDLGNVLFWLMNLSRLEINSSESLLWTKRHLIVNCFPPNYFSSFSTTSWPSILAFYVFWKNSINHPSLSWLLTKDEIIKQTILNFMSARNAWACEKTILRFFECSFLNFPKSPPFPLPTLLPYQFVAPPTPSSPLPRILFLLF